MKKNVYSVVLSEDVVAAIDRLAYVNGTNRSGMINRILAEYVSYETPEMKLRNIFSEISEMLCAHDNFKLISDAADTVMSLRSPIVYKYNPSVRYSIELYKSSESNSVGKIRALLRTQNTALIEYFAEFCREFDNVEKKFNVNVPSTISEGKYSRLIVPKSNPYAAGEGGGTLGDIIGRYIYMFDNCLKAFFASDGVRNRYLPEMIALYSDYISNNKEII